DALSGWAGKGESAGHTPSRAEATMQTHPPEPRQVHRLPPAPDFLGRQAELAQLHSFWEGGGRGVLALVGLGGAGKTALAARFLGDLLGPGRARRPRGLFVWSFY